MNLVDQIFQQAQLGTSQTPNANPFLEGVQVGQQQQRINLANRQLAAELATLPLKMTQMQQQNELGSLQIEGQLRQRQNYLDSTKAFNDVANQVSPLLKSGKIDDAMRTVVAAGLDNNFLLTDPRFQSLSKTVDAMHHEANVMELRKATLALAGRRADIAEFRSKPIFERLQMEADNFDQAGDPEMADKLRAQANLEKEKLDVRKQELGERARRNDIRQQAIDKSLDAVGRAAFNSQMRDIENAPHMTLEQREAEREKALQSFEAKTRSAHPTPISPTTPTTGTNDVTPAGMPPAPAKVRVRAPDGRTGLVPSSWLNDAISQGFTPIQ